MYARHTTRVHHDDTCTAVIGRSPYVEYYLGRLAVVHRLYMDLKTDSYDKMLIIQKGDTALGRSLIFNAAVDPFYSGDMPTG